MTKKRLFSILLVIVLLSTLLASTSMVSMAADNDIIHTVKYGETLGWIAWRYGVTVREIMDANDLTNANYIYAGEKLTIPVPESDYTTYTVVSGDSLLTIAAQFGVTVRDIARANGLWNINLIYVGEELLIPVTSSATPTPTARPWRDGNAHSERDLHTRGDRDQ